MVISLPVCALGSVGCGAVQPQQSRIPIPKAPACTDQNLAPELLFAGAKSGVAVVSTDSMTGSGFVVRHQDGSTFLVTNAHVVDGFSSATVKWADGGQDSAAVVSNAGGSSPLTDLALLEVKSVRGTPLNLKASKPSVGADIVAIGAPQGLEFSLTRGVVSSLRDNGEILQIDAPINPGNSGGPVLDRTGCVVGVATFKMADSEGLNFAVASSVIQRFLANPVAVQPSSAARLPEALLNPSNPGSPIGTGATCWFQSEPGSDQLDGYSCNVSSRTNANGHKVYDVIEPGGLLRTVVLWENQTAEVLLNGKRYEGQWQKDDEGDIRVDVNGGVFAFRYRE